MPVAHTKRFLERWTAQPAFRAAFDADPAGTVAAAGLDIDPHIVPYLVDDKVKLGARLRADVAAGVSQLPPEVSAYRRFILDKFAYRDEMRAQGAPGQTHFRAWRKRQMARVLFELGQVRSVNLVHPPLCVELSDGCTVGCWFCGISAERFAGNFLYTPDNAALWRDVLEVLDTTCGRGVSQGFCYWATDPFDNPDYERFLTDFHARFGVLPQTTTAQPLKDIDRTRRFLALSRELGGKVERFSVLSARTYERLFELFTPEELLHVELIPQFNHDASPKALAGSSRARAQRMQAKQKPVQGDLDDGGTIACVSGLLLNMPRRHVKLISPCSPSERWPLGYITFAEFHFDDAPDLQARLLDLFRTTMSLSMGRNDPVRLVPGLTIRTTDTGLAIASRHVRGTFDGFDQPHHLAEAVRRGRHTAGTLAAERLRRFGIPALNTFRDLGTLRSSGVLSEEPPEVPLPVTGSTSSHPESPAG